MRHLPQPGEMFGRYRIEGTIGRGGMGVVLKARQVDLDRLVALKLLAPELSAEKEYLGRFRREAAALGRLDSPHVVRAYDAGECDGWLFIATQYVPDGDLAGLLSAAGPLPPVLALQLIGEVLIGLGDAHAAGLLHRDIKPSNVLIRRQGSQVHAVLCDLGISQFVDAGASVTNTAIGTPTFMAPERFAGAPASIASDLYAVGCLLWCMVSGSPPYAGTHVSVMLSHERDPIPQLPLTLLGAGRVNELLLRSMAKQPAHRYPSAPAMRQAAAMAVASPQPPPASPSRPSPRASSDAVTTMPRSQDGPTLAGPPLRPLAPPPAPTPSSHPSAPPRRRRLPALLAVAATLVVALVVGMVLAITLDDSGDSGGSGDAGTAAGAASKPGTTAVTASSAPTAGSSTILDPAAEDAGDTGDAGEAAEACWDDVTFVDDLADCPTLRGVQAVRWVFKADLGEGCVEEPAADPAVVQQWTCQLDTVDAGRATAIYREWSTVDSADRYFTRAYGSGGVLRVNDAGQAVLWRWADRPGHRGTFLFDRAPFSVTLTAPNSDNILRTMQESVSLRKVTTFPAANRPLS